MAKLIAAELVEEFPLYDITVDEEHCFRLENDVIAHNSKKVVSGGTGIYYSANTIFIMGRRQNKKGTDVVGYDFVVNVEKSRFVKEKSQVPIRVTWDEGVTKASGLLDVALAGQFVAKPKVGWYSKIDLETGELLSPNVREAETQKFEWWTEVLNHEPFKEFVRDVYKIGHTSLVTDGDILEATSEV